MDMEDATEKIKEDQANDEISFKPELWMNLDNESAPISVISYYQIHNVEEMKRRSTIIPLCSMFNLMQSCEKRLTGGGLEDVDGLLGCGVVLFQLTDLEIMTRELRPEEFEEACNLLYYTINWFRELITSFSTLKESDIHQKLILRLKNVLLLEAVLAKFLKHVPLFVPFEFQPQPSLMSSKGTSSRAHVLDAVSSQGVQIHRSSSGPLDSQVDVFKAPFKKENNNRFHTVHFDGLDDLRHQMRTLEVHTLSILRPLELVEEEEDKEEVKLEYEDINYLLRELDQKIEFKLTSSGKRKSLEEKIASNDTFLMQKTEVSQFMKEHYIQAILLARSSECRKH
ncbi:Fanconi anaemia protein FancD2 nuclease-domain-containing protein [Spinellus fusiger]|nr:Fanconi anaemia protein FancD2 nuclease-domain-containing protein [Spinellus fusiger]